MGAARWRDVWSRFAGKGAYPYELAWLLLAPGRGLVLSPETLVERLDLGPEDRVLELGPGPGYFSPAIAARLRAGRLDLFDLQPEMLCKARRRLRRAGHTNVGLTCGSGESLPYRDDNFDVVVLVAVLGELADPRRCLIDVARVTCPGGLVSITELPGDPDAITTDQLVALADRAGLAFCGSGPLTRGRRGFTASFHRPT